MDHDNNEPPIDSDNNNSNSVASNRQWTCDACGCNTNRFTTDRNCTICGTPINPHNPFHHGNFTNPHHHHHHLHLGGSSSPQVRRAALMAVPSSMGVGSINGNVNDNSSYSNATGYSAAIRAGFLARSLSHHAARAATGNNNNNSSAANNSNSITAVQLAAAAAASNSLADDYGFDDDDVWESVMHGVVDPTNNYNVPPHPLELQFSLGVSSYATVRNRYIAESNRQQRFLQLEAASRAFTNSIREPLQPSSPPPTLVVEPDELFRVATFNSAFYQPSWAVPGATANGSSPTSSTRTSRSTNSSALHINCGIELWGNGLDRNQVAHVQLGATEGRAIRAEPAFPNIESATNTNSNSFDPFRLAASLSPTNSNDSDSFDLLCNTEISSLQQHTARPRIYGFRVAFDNSAFHSDDDKTAVGMDLGGCFLVGVTSSSFSSFTEFTTLQESNAFWGIEDHGRIYEGSRKDVSGNEGSTTAARTSGLFQRQHDRRRPYSQLSDDSRSASTGLSAAVAASLSMELGGHVPSHNATINNNAAVPMNSHSVLFGVRDVITVVCNLDHRSLTFWRNETLLGTLVSNLPRSGDLYPIAVPFTSGATIAISGISCDPLPMLRSFGIEWREKQEDKNLKIRCKLAKDRAVLIKDGKPTVRLQKVLRQIFSRYMDSDIDSNEVDDGASITEIMASRLWYRCGMKLSVLEDIFLRNEARTATFLDFYRLITEVIEDDEYQMLQSKPSPRCSIPSLHVQVGDKVELVEGFEKFRDATSGPLQVGDRGVVVEVQRGPNGETRSVRVLHSGRRWWYLMQAIVSEKSGLVDSPAVWFLSNILRAHGFDYTTLTSIVARPVTSTSWRVGDVVTHKSAHLHAAKKLSLDTPASLSMIGRVVVETSSLGSSPSSSPTHSRPNSSVSVEFISGAFSDAVGIKPANLSSLHHETRRVKTSKLVHTTEFHGNQLRMQANCGAENDGNMLSKSFDPTTISSNSINEKIVLDIEAIESLDISAIASVVKESRKSTDALASMFASGLPDAIMTALCVIERHMNSFEPKDDLPGKIAAIGNLVNAVTEQLYCSSSRSHELDVMDIEIAETLQSSPWQNAPQSLRFRGSLQSHFYNPTQQALNRDDDGRENSQAVVSSLQQSNSMLLSTTSRATSEDNEGSRINETSYGNTDHQDNVSPRLHDLFPTHFRETEENESRRPSVHSQTSTLIEYNNLIQRLGVDKSISSQKNKLDSSLRCHGPGSSQPIESKKQGGAAYAGFIRHLIRCGLLFDSVEWTDALIAGYCKNFLGRSQSKVFTILKGVVDEEGTPILLLAIALGCNVDVISSLIKHGASVDSLAIIHAARSNQPRTLSLLLQHTSYKEGIIDLETCDPFIQQLLNFAKFRQDELSKKMEDAAGDFMVKLVMKLFELGLSSRQIRNPRIDKCSKIICDVLVGNVLLRALQTNQKAISQAEESKKIHSKESNHLANDSEIRQRPSKLQPGLLIYLPESVFSDYLFNDTNNITKFLLYCEDFLCSRNISDVASGLTLLSTILAKFPQIKYSSELERFGVAEFVSNHNVLSSNHIADILSNELNVGLDVSGHSARTREDSGERGTVKQTTCSAVYCPKKHIASLHYTQHSNFRCDICGHAVPEGEFIFGCRECDYDECLDCTLRDERRTLCIHMAIVEIAVECHRQLSEERMDATQAARKIHGAPACGEELRALSFRLLQQDVYALRDLGLMLNTPGHITVHEFLTLILPALHASIVGQGTTGVGTVAHTGTNHRKKKARSSSVSKDNHPDNRLLYCRKALRHMCTNLIHAPDVKFNTVPARKILENSLVDSEIGGAVEDQGEKLDISISKGASELLRRLHQILSFYEDVPVISATIDKSCHPTSNGQNDDLYELTKPLELLLLPSNSRPDLSESSTRSAVIYAEPLIPLSELYLHLFRAHRINSPSYTAYCQSIALENAIIIERPKSDSSIPWRIAKVERYDETTGGHTLRYASGWKRGKERSCIRLEGFCEDLSYLTYDAQVLCILATREYYILCRKTAQCLSNPMATSSIPREVCESISDSSRLVQAIGSRVESSCCDGSDWRVLTLAGIDVKASAESTNGMRFVLVTDEGEIFKAVSGEQIRARGSIVRDEYARPRQTVSSRLSADDQNNFFPFLALRERVEFARTSGERLLPSFSEAHNQTKALKRTWSALSLLNDMRPQDLKVSRDSTKVKDADQDIHFVSMDCKLNDLTLQFFANEAILEFPPVVTVQFSTNEKLPTVDLMVSPDTTLFASLKALYQKQKKLGEWSLKSTKRLFFSFEISCKSSNKFETKIYHDPGNKVDVTARLLGQSSAGTVERDCRSRKLSISPTTKDDEMEIDYGKFLCDGIDEICVQCMEIINIISECAKDPTSPSDRDLLNLPGFANLGLSLKLTEQLNQSICCAGSALPSWCVITPAYAPLLFTYESRRMLLERTAFGPSRSTLCQQEAKVNVGKLRLRMASLRARAVELVGEAFAGGAEDPTALQLQADELYGMEEALASKVKSAFRAAKWQEHALQVAKAAVRRDRLLSDAAAVMDSYTNDRTVCRRRLEVRFEGESGFDAASGDEAGVTRGFYADVAEALLSADNVAGVCCTSACSPVATSQQVGSIEIEDPAMKVPLWIPDMDSTAQMIIPTPRAGKDSLPGVFPRPIPHYHPQHDAVMKMFRLIGRLFAAALRDGFMFPVPLSASFLKLVQRGHSSRFSGDNEYSPLVSSDLPRPGFMGGEIYAAEFYVCRELDRLDKVHPPLSRHDLKRAYDEIAADPNFGRVAFGKTYDCSFEDYFQDRTFVDPLDPAQDAEAAPLCHKGHTKSITIFNVREWVALAKKFVLFDGVIEQATAFRSGVDDFFSSEYLRVFTSEELQRDVCGVGDNVDNWKELSIRKLFKLDGGNGATEALVAVAAIGGEGGAALSRRFGPSSPTISFLIKALLEASSTQRRQFLSFVTSLPIATAKMGTIEVVPILSPSGEFLPMHDPSCLPRANTCSRRLYLPRFETYESFSQVLWAVVREESKFKGFYEWRGT